MVSLKNCVSTLLVLFCSTQLAAQIKIYGNLQGGLSFSPSINFKGLSNDRSSICDEFINPNYAQVTSTDCTKANRGEGDGWSTDFDSGQGKIGQIALGVYLNEFLRIEGEYHFNIISYNQTAKVKDSKGVNTDKINNEIEQAKERLGDLNASNVYANVVITPIINPNTKWTPFIGGGLGYGFLRVDYSSIWARNRDPNQISTGTGQPNEQEIKENLAGTVSAGNAKLEDNDISWQAFGGLELRLSENTFLIFKANYLWYNEFVGEGLEWDPLRSHVPNIRKDGSEAVDGTYRTNDFDVFSLSLGLKYDF